MALAAMVLAAGCGSDEPAGSGTGTDTARSRGIAAYERPPSRAPKPHIPDGPPPKRLVVKDYELGTGPAVRQGDHVIVNYVGHHYANKRRYDTSYDRHNPLPLEAVPGRGDLIDGFEQGIVGMRVGGLRQVTIPPQLGYGDRGYTGQVEPGETVVFVVELEELVPARRD